MAPMSSIKPQAGPPDAAAGLAAAHRRQLLDLAWSSIRQGLANGRPVRVDPAEYPDALRRAAACFVTLHRRGALRGCIGHLSAVQPLAADVAENAFAAAFRDPRFPPLEADELEGLTLDISVLGTPEPMQFRDEPDLLAQLRPGRDGLILEDGAARATFLPAVWESLPEPRRFFEELKRKAGLPRGYWSRNLTVSRYRTESFGD